jgi:chromosome segregation ATPase
MTKDTTHDEDLAATDQAATQSQPDVWEQKYNSLRGKLLEVQNQLAEAKIGFKDERGQWEVERKQMVAQSEQMSQALQGAEGMIGELTGKWNTLQAQAEVLNSQLARQQVILKYPQLISDPIVKLAQASQLAPEDLEATLSALAASQQQLVRQTYQEAQAGATTPVNPATAPASAHQGQEKADWTAALKALEIGDMKTFQAAYGSALRFTDGGKFQAPIGRSVIGRS